MEQIRYLAWMKTKIQKSAAKDIKKNQAGKRTKNKGNDEKKRNARLKKCTTELRPYHRFIPYCIQNNHFYAM
jgi:hypothetical protein